MDHLNEQEIARCVDALMNDQHGQLPEYMLNHVEECEECKVEVMGVLDLIASIGFNLSLTIPRNNNILTPSVMGKVIWTIAQLDRYPFVSLSIT